VDRLGIMASNLGYQDTPIIPGTNWHVHDGERPQPPVVSTVGPRPSDAINLFDGTSLDGWLGGNGVAEWTLENGYMEVKPGTGNICTKELLGDCQLHLEFAAPTVVKGDGQGRGNSGVFLMRKYEIQVLDCFQNPTYPDGTVGGVYGQFPPMSNPMRAPGEWNVYDILWKAPVFEGEILVSPAMVTVILNGVVLQHGRVLQGATEHRALAQYVKHDPTGALELQDHGDLVRFRNIWFRPLVESDVAGKPA